MKKISVIIPVYNIEKYLPKCLQSIEEQSVFQDLEIILIDDGSKDDSGKICDAFAAKHKNATVTHKKNGGVSSARNAGIESATGEYISFVDGDDYLDSNHFDEFFKDIDNTNSDLIIHDYYVEFENSFYKYRKNKIKKEFKREESIKEILSGGIIGNNLFDKVFKKSKLGNVRFDSKIRIGEDLLFIYQFLKNTNKSFARNIATYHYIQRQGSAMNSNFSDKFFDIIEVSKVIESDIKKNYSDLINYAQALTIYSKYKTLERAYKSNDYSDYQVQIDSLNKDIKEYKLLMAYKYLSIKKFLGLLLIKISPKLYLLVCKIKHI